MAKSYKQIIKQFQTTIKQCEARTGELQTKRNQNEEAAAKLISQNKEFTKEQQQTENLAKKLQDFIGA